MSLTVTKYPDRTINENIDTVSKWNSIHHPIKFEMQREDEQTFISSVNAPFSVGQVIDVLGIDVTGVGADFNIGDQMFIKTNSGRATVTIDSVTGNALNCTINELSGWIGGYGFSNFLSRKNYFVRTKIHGVDQFGAYYEIGESINKPDASGKVTVDVASFLKSFAGYENTFQFDTLNKKDEGLGGRYNISYSENWQGFEGEFSGLSSTLLRYYTNSAKQIQDVYGSNMGEYVPFVNYDPLDDRAKFLSDFETPTYFPNFPFSLSFIFSDSIYVNRITKKELKRNINNGIVGITGAELDANEGLGVNQFMLDGSYASNVYKTEVRIEKIISQPEVLFDYVADDYVLEGYVEQKSGLPTVGESVSVDDPVL